MQSNHFSDNGQVLVIVLVFSGPFLVLMFLGIFYVVGSGDSGKESIIL